MSSDRTEINPVKFIEGVQLSVKYTRQDDIKYIRQKLDEGHNLQDILNSSYFVRTQDSSLITKKIFKKQNQ